MAAWCMLNKRNAGDMQEPKVMEKFEYVGVGDLPLHGIPGLDVGA